MRPFYTIAVLCFLLTRNIDTSAQIRANFIENNSKPSAFQVEAYRNSIWENPPNPDGWTNDYEGIFAREEENSLSGIIIDLESRTGIEIAIVTVDSNMVAIDKFEEFADHLLHTWGVGKKEKENGILICISSQYKKITISRGAGTDKYLSDPIVRSLIAKSFIPMYKKYNYYGGTLNGLTGLIKFLQPAP